MDIFGDGVNVPARMANQAKARQILNNRGYSRSPVRTFTRVRSAIDLAQIRGKQERLAIYELVWEVDGATFMQEPWPIARHGGTRLILMGGGTQLELGDAFRH